MATETDIVRTISQNNIASLEFFLQRGDLRGLTYARAVDFAVRRDNYEAFLVLTQHEKRRRMLSTTLLRLLHKQAYNYLDVLEGENKNQLFSLAVRSGRHSLVKKTAKRGS